MNGRAFVEMGIELWKGKASLARVDERENSASFRTEPLTVLTNDFQCSGILTTWLRDCPKSASRLISKRGRCHVVVGLSNTVCGEPKMDRCAVFGIASDIAIGGDVGEEGSATPRGGREARRKRVEESLKKR